MRKTAFEQNIGVIECWKLERRFD